MPRELFLGDAVKRPAAAHTDGLRIELSLTSSTIHPARTNRPVKCDILTLENEKIHAVGKDAQRPCGHRSRPLTSARASRPSEM